MTVRQLEPIKLRPVTEADKSWMPVSVRLDEPHRELVDMACAKLNQPRSHFLARAGIEKAAAELGVIIEWDERAAVPQADGDPR